MGGRAAAAVVAVIAFGAAAAPARAQLTTPWTALAEAGGSPLPEYPRPQLKRSEWLNLNGHWEFGSGVPGIVPPAGALGERILVPFPQQAPLSGVGTGRTHAWYRRSFAVPAGWAGRRVRLNFGAVTHVATVYVNGQRVGEHRGSYDAFAFDITDHLRPGGNELAVEVVDPTNFGGANPPAGKQLWTNPAVTPSTAFFTPSTGIWQTVWLEPVGAAHVERLDMTPDLKRRRLVVRPLVVGGENASVRLVARARGRIVGRASGLAGSPLRLPIRGRLRKWTPEHPFLYDLDATVVKAGRVTDRVDSYFGMRSIAVRRVGGVPRFVLNGRYRFQVGTLDQGYWPDGIYTAPTDDALRFDLEAHKRLGFNLVRKHVKVEPQRWYYHADRLGLLVWQDMPSMTVYRPVLPDDARQFEVELRELVDEHRSSPSVVAWVPFNEGWGQFDVDRIVGAVERWDPSRLVIGHSGSANCCEATEPAGGDARSSHLYPGPLAVAPDAKRASVVSEFNGCGLRAPGHEWRPGDPQSSAPNGSLAANRGWLRTAWDQLRQQIRTPGIAAAVYTEITDVEREISACLLTYDRRRYKVRPGLVRALNARLLATRPRRAQRARIAPRPLAHWSFDGTLEDAVGGRLLTLGGGGRLAGEGHLEADASAPAASTDVAVVDGRRGFTVAAWLRSDQHVVSGTAAGQKGAFAVGLRVGGQRPDALPALVVAEPDGAGRAPYWRWSLSTGSAVVDSAYDDGRQAPPDEVWQHVVATVDRDRRVASLYVDGLHVSTAIADTPGGDSDRLVLGDGFDGAIDDLRLYDRVLGPAAVWRLRAVGRPGPRASADR